MDIPPNNGSTSIKTHFSDKQKLIVKLFDQDVRRAKIRYGHASKKNKASLLVPGIDCVVSTAGNYEFLPGSCEATVEAVVAFLACMAKSLHQSQAVRVE